MNPFTTLLQKVIAYAALALVVVFAALAFTMWLRGKGLEADLRTCQKAKAEAEGKIVLQNQEIDGWKSAAVDAEQRGAVALRKARVVSQAVRPRSDTLQARILASAGQSCSDAMREIRGELK